VSNSPEKQLEEFLASKPTWMQRYFQTGLGSLHQDEFLEWSNNVDEVFRLTSEYEQILKLIPARWREYRKRLKRENDRAFGSLVPKGKPGRPVDSKAGEYFEQHSGKSSYAEIAKQELQQELQSVPENEAKTLLIEKESERIRAIVRRARRRNRT